jgi:diguanylate cyclase (GGDEF)-like protein
MGVMLQVRNPTSEGWIGLVRVAILLMLIPALWFGVIPVTASTVTGIIALFGGYAILVALGPRWLQPLRKADLIIASDILVVTLAVLLSGSLNSPFIYLYCLTTLEAAARFNFRQAIAASLAMVAMIVLLWTRSGELAMLQTTAFRRGAVIAGGFLLALLLSVLVQGYRATRTRPKRAEAPEPPEPQLPDTTAQLEEQLQESRSFNELAGRLSGELRVEGVLEILLQFVLAATGLPKGVAYVLGEDGAPQFATALGVDWGKADRETESLSFPTLPADAIGGEVLIQSAGDEGQPPRFVAYIPLIRAGSLRAWLCGLGTMPEAFPEPVLRRIRGMAAQGVSSLEAARLHEEVQRMVSVNPARSLYPWNQLHRLVAEEIRRCSELVLVFSLAEIQLENYGGTTWTGDHDRDLALRRVVKLLQTSLRRVDVISHDGAGRFMLLLSRVSKAQALEILRRLTQKLEEDSLAARLLELNRLVVTAGLVTFPEDGNTVSDLIDKLKDLIAEGPSTPNRVHVPNA